MTLNELFRTFLTDHVNLNQTRIEKLQRSSETLQGVIETCNWGVEIIDFIHQGSWAHQTIIKPLPNKEFDADLLIRVKPKIGWTAKEYVNSLATKLEGTGRYSGKVRRYSHCATIEYSGEQRIDLAPCIVNRQYSGQFEVCNRGSDEFEMTAPEAYSNWIEERNRTTRSNNLIKVTRLLKYLRDIKGNFTCPSFLLTTLLGMQVHDYDNYLPEFNDLPSALKTIVGRLDNWLQLRAYVPEIQNPVLRTENQAQGWTSTQFSNFKDKIHLYREWIDDAYDEKDRDESIGKWRRVFGDSFAASEVVAAGRQISESTTDSMSALALPGQSMDLVSLVTVRGVAALPTNLTRLPYMSRPVWKRATRQISVVIVAELCQSKTGPTLKQVKTLDLLKTNYWLRFTALGTMGIGFSQEYIVKWRVTNTGALAANAGALRGQFYDSDSNSSRMEHLEYRGVHLVEAFVIKRSDLSIVGQSAPFYVVIE